MNYQSKSFRIAFLALLAGCNAAMELTLGNYLHYIKFPLVGSIMVGINVIIYSAGYSVIPRRGTILTIGFITAILNLFFGGSFKIWAILAIFLEAAIIEMIISGFGLKLFSILSASVVSNLFSLVYTFFTISVVLGIGFSEALVRVISRITSNFNFLGHSLLMAGILVVFFHIINSFLFGYIAWKFISITGKVTGERINTKIVE